MTLFLVGLVSLLAQVVLLRELNVAFYGVELVYLVALAAWLAGSAAGAAIVPGRRPASPGAARLLVAGAGLALPLEAALVRGSRLLLGGVPGAYLPIERQLLVLAVSVLPIAAAFGLAFRWAAHAHVEAGGRLARAYAIESLGAAAGGLAATFAFKAGVQTLALALATATLTLVAVVLARPWSSRRRRAVAAGLALACGVAALARSQAWDLATTGWSHPFLVQTRDTPYGRVSLSRHASQVSMFENDVLVYDSESAENELLPHLAALQHPAPRRVLLLGGTIEGLGEALARHHPARLERIEIDRAMVSAARQVMARPAVPLRIADPRAYLARAEDYDLIVSALPEPLSGQASRFYTREFFDACAARLGPAGILGLRLQVPENYLSPAALQRTASVALALRAAFPFVDFLPGPTTIAVASRSPLPGPDLLVRRLEERRLDARLVTPPLVRYLFTNDRRDELKQALASARVPVNRDLQPVSYLYAAVAWLSKFAPSLIGADPAALSAPAAWPWPVRFGIPAAAALLLALSRLTRRTRRVALALAAGLAGMVLETVVLLGYQARNGALFEEIGVLVMAFMAGSALGAWALDAAGLGPAAADDRRGPSGRKTRHPHATAALLLAALAACSVVSVRLVASPAAFGGLRAALLLAAIGAGVGGVFACASGLVDRDDEVGMGRLYGADLVGGCVGSLAASLLLVPLGGLDLTAHLVAGFSLLALLAV